jgi:hypothetical protein
MVELEIPAKYSALVKGDKLFLEAYSINPGFLFKYLNKEIIITLPIKQNDKHFLYYLVPLLEKIISDLEA